MRCLSLICVLLFAGASQAAIISVESLGPNKPPLVIVSGPVNAEDGQQFKEKVGPLSNATLWR